MVFPDIKLISTLGLSAVLAIVDALHNSTEGVGYTNDDQV